MVNFFTPGDAVALDVDVDVGVDVAAQPVDRLGQRHVDGRLVVDADDVVLGLHADADGGRVGHRALDRDAVLLVHLDHDPQAAELPLGLGPHVLVGLDVEQHRVRVERVEHAVGRRHLDLDQAPRLFLLGDRLQVRLHEAEDLLQRAAQAPGGVDPLDREAALLAVDLHRHLLGVVLGPAVDQDLGDVALDEVERADQHPLGIEAVLVEVVLADVEQRLREDRELRQVVLARRRCGWRRAAGCRRPPGSRRRRGESVRMSAALQAAENARTLLNRRMRDSGGNGEGETTRDPRTDRR